MRHIPPVCQSGANCSAKWLAYLSAESSAKGFAVQRQPVKRYLVQHYILHSSGSSVLWNAQPEQTPARLGRPAPTKSTNVKPVAKTITPASTPNINLRNSVSSHLQTVKGHRRCAHRIRKDTQDIWVGGWFRDELWCQKRIFISIAKRALHWVP